MTNLIILITSLMLNMGTVSFELPVLSSNYQDVVDLIPDAVEYYNLNNTHGNTASVNDVIFVTRYLSSYSFYFSRESMGETNINSTYLFSLSSTLPEYEQWAFHYNYYGFDSVRLDLKGVFSMGSSVDFSGGSCRLSPSFEDIPNFDKIRLLFLRNYEEYYLIDQKNKPPVFDFNGVFNSTSPPANLDFSGHSNAIVSSDALAAESGNFIQNILAKINNTINSIGSNIVSGFNGIFSLLGQINNNIGSLFGNFFSHIKEFFGDFFAFPTSDDLSLFLSDTKILGDLHNTFVEQYSLFSEFYYDWTINNNDDFVIDLTFPFLGSSVGGSFSMRSIFGNSLGTVRTVTSVFIYLGTALFILRAFPSILGNTSVIDETTVVSRPWSGFPY